MKMRGMAIAMVMFSEMALAQAPSCSILNFGVFTEVETYNSREALVTPSGREFLAHPRAAIQQTDRVPGRLGVMFGVVHDFEGIPAGGFIAAVVRHPPLPAKDGGTRTESLLRKEPEAAATGFRFDRSDEIVRGAWSFEFQYQGNVLCRKAFIVE